MPEPESFRFNLINEPWIPCERTGGGRVLLGLEDALLQAHTLSAVHDESPLTTAMLHRGMLAILHRVLAPRTIEDWTALWEARSFDGQKLMAYFKKWRERFDLFHPERPWLQVSQLEEVLTKERGKAPEPTPAWRLALETSQHSAATQLFEATPDNAAITPAEAARALLSFLAFTPGGRIQNDADSRKSGSLRAGAVILIRGATLRETLLLNLVWRPNRSASDVPPWERDTPAQRTNRAPFGPVDQMVWVSRRVRLMPVRDERGDLVVRDVVTAAGEDMDGHELIDPMFSYVKRDPKSPPFTVRIDPDRSAWRDAGALFNRETGESTRRPAACEQLAQLVFEDLVPRSARFNVDVLGLASNQAAIRLWRAERMPLPPSLLVDRARMSILREALNDAEKVGSALDRQVLRTLCQTALAPGGREAHRDDVAKLVDALGAMAAYWGALGLGFSAWLELLGQADDVELVLAAWRETLRAVTRTVVHDAAQALGTTARALQAGAIAERALSRALAEALPTPGSTSATPSPATSPDVHPTRGASQ
jgi:CRISPR system Cascade subunit CasA